MESSRFEEDGAASLPHVLSILRVIPEGKRSGGREARAREVELPAIPEKL